MMMNIQIITPEKIAFQGEIDSITIPTNEGEITVLAKHVPMVSTIKHGTLIMRKGDQEIIMAIYKGFIEVRKSGIIIMTDIAERVDEIDSEKAEKARLEASKRLQEKDRMDDIAFADTIAIIDKSMARIKTSRKKHRRNKR